MGERGHQHSGQKSPGYETSDVDVRIIWISGIIIAAIVVFSFFYMHHVFNSYMAKINASRPDPSTLLDPDPMPPAPRLRVKPAIEIEQLRTYENAMLDSYTWIDEAQGVARIPVARAMALIAAHGVPAMPAPAEPAMADPAAEPAAHAAPTEAP